MQNSKVVARVLNGGKLVKIYHENMQLKSGEHIGFELR